MADCYVYRTPAARGRKMSPEPVEKSAAGHRGKKQPPEAVAKSAAARRG
jgi:hypothetical protein